MADARRDENRVPTLTAVSNADGSTPLSVFAHPTDHAIIVATPSGTVPANGAAIHDANHVPTLIAVSSVDQQTVVPISLSSVTKGLFLEYQ